jgi:hypothetical protein
MKGKNLGRLFLGYDKKEEDRSSSFLIMAFACRAQLFRFTVVMLSLLAALLPSACRRHASLSGLSPSCFPRWRPAAVLGCPYPSRREGSVAPMPLRP